nr:MAG TPA: hypothetical protein [Caudoviricetes sp.]
MNPCSNHSGTLYILKSINLGYPNILTPTFPGATSSITILPSV